MRVPCHHVSSLEQTLILVIAGMEPRQCFVWPVVPCLGFRAGFRASVLSVAGVFLMFFDCGVSLSTLSLDRGGVLAFLASPDTGGIESR